MIIKEGTMNNSGPGRTQTDLLGVVNFGPRKIRDYGSIWKYGSHGRVNALPHVGQRTSCNNKFRRVMSVLNPWNDKIANHASDGRGVIGRARASFRSGERARRDMRDFDAGMDSQPETYFNYFNLVKVDELTVRSDPPHNATYTADRAFGGLIVSQAVNSFLSIYPARSPHTINYKFIAAVNPSIPLHFKLNPFEDCSVLRVFVYQGDKHVGSCHIQFSNSPELLDSTHFNCPEYGPPSEYLTRKQSKVTRNVMSMIDKIPLELRPVESPLCHLSQKDRCSYWMRIKPQCQDILKPTDGLVVLLFISDFAILQVAEEIYLKAKIKPFCWYLTVSECEVICHGRVRLESRIFNEAHKCVMTVLQEGYIQRRMIRSLPLTGLLAGSLVAALSTTPSRPASSSDSDSSVVN
ncbi:hypothetical protein PRIPAC_84941 [Pristionchus pacificus]|uniref:Uncharacterized protein n=1 Tax=Pristionchus pacificus TaxID=54126 RepID=A0A2A6BS17_PRIPA|nr:hypothetical protein PRIPAC_84941 [Pristionchus pacificus]|eukprot:PDM68742.1 hypothetical protein PRIPAC_47044 [Pristionchus pacificus]